jgi:putative Mg2+ transporter-C (MgtC) family protein
MELEAQEQLILGLRLLVAALLGGVIGLERERRGQAAGLGTFAIVTMGACAFSIISDSVFRGPDNTRIASGVVEGIGFLGAGIIIQGRAGIHGLTTAASLWASAAVGMLIGFGLYVLAALMTVVVLLVLVVRAVHPIARQLEKLRVDTDADDATGQEPPHQSS